MRITPIWVKRRINFWSYWTQQKKCFCYKEHATSVCIHCSTVRYLLNFKVDKFCFEHSELVRKFLKENFCISLDQYLIENPAEPFSFCKNPRIVISLDNPRYSVQRKTDFRLISNTSYIKKMNKKESIGSKYVPQYSGDYFSKPWYERDLMHYFDYVDYQEMCKHQTNYFKDKKIINFDLIHH